jgi:hypothetical protein
MLYYICQTNLGENMKVGTLYKVIKNDHTYPQVGDVVVLVKVLGGMFEGLNLRTNRRHHYFFVSMEVICE